MKILGVIGGLGPLATVYFMQLVVEMTDASKDQEHIEMIVHSRPSIPDRTNYILKRSEDNPLPHMLDIEKKLVSQGAQVIAIPCITAHYFQPELDRHGIKVINAIKETAVYLKKSGIRKAGIMATDGTIESGLFQEAFKEYDIDFIVPDEDNQKKVMSLIYNDIKAGKKPQIDKFFEVKQMLQDGGAEVVLLGCTELSIIKRDCDTGRGVLDVMEVLAQQSVIECGKLKPEYNNCLLYTSPSPRD